ncbi:hypothetical protein KC357_g216 [Hortaea werneckii]|nr:hypothetical protein KC357_g216 [Hortaea werneckii]
MSRLAGDLPPRSRLASGVLFAFATLRASRLRLGCTLGGLSGRWIKLRWSSRFHLDDLPRPCGRGKVKGRRWVRTRHYDLGRGSTYFPIQADTEEQEQEDYMYKSRRGIYGNRQE